jgi:hypothetical protein
MEAREEEEEEEKKKKKKRKNKSFDSRSEDTPCGSRIG